MDFTHIPRALVEDYERRIRNLAVVLDEAIERTEQCWLWRRATDGPGYGLISVGGRMLKAHRLLWEITNGPIPKGLVVCHECNVKACCRPDHLYLATSVQNSKDAAEDGLYRRGRSHGTHTHPDSRERGEDHWTRRYPEKLHRGDEHWLRRLPERARDFQRAGTVSVAILDEAKVREMRSLWVTRQYSQASLAERFGVAVGQVSRIVTHKAWKHVE